MNQITLIRSTSGWLARVTDPSIIAAFGSDTIPTAFTQFAPPAQVQREISRLNPGVVVVVDETENAS